MNKSNENTNLNERKRLFAVAKRLVIKIGSSLILDSGYNFDMPRLKKLSQQLVSLKKNGKEVIIVASGAISAGSILYNPIRKIYDEYEIKQAAAALGQCLLIESYRNSFAQLGQKVAQLLITRRQLSNNPEALKLSNTINALLSDPCVIPIFNENDPLSQEGARLRENDKLAVILACFCHADLLIILSDVAGFYTEDPKKNPNATLLTTVEQITPQILGRKEYYKPSKGLGGMSAKIDAARIALSSGMPMIIANGNEDELFEKLALGRIGTLFLCSTEQRKYKNALMKQPKGTVIVDDGAKEAILNKGASLLSVGVLDIQGRFVAGDTIVIADHNIAEFARGVAERSSRELLKTVRKIKTGKMEDTTIKTRISVIVVHRNRMALV